MGVGIGMGMTPKVRAQGGYFPSSLQQPNDGQQQPHSASGGRTTGAPDFTPPSPDPNRVRYAVPDRIFLARAETMMKKIYAPDYADPKPIARRTLAIKLLKQATLTNDDPSMKYVLFRESRD